MVEDTAGRPEAAPGREPVRLRGVVAVVASVLAVVVVAVGGFAAWRFLDGGGPRPADVLPATTVALVSLDLDPSAGQKIQALRTLRKFPAFDEQLSSSSDSDLVRSLFEHVLASGPCASLSYDEDVAPWIGQRAGVGGVLLGDEPVPVLALQVSDAEKAGSGFRALARCSGPEEGLGWTVSGDYLLASDSSPHARAIAAAGAKASLSADPAYRRWTDAAGGDGVLNVYVAERAATLAGDRARSFLRGLGQALRRFEGAAAVLRFADGGVELSFAYQGPGSKDAPSVTEHVAALPADTAAVLALAVPDSLVEAIRGSGGGTGDRPFSLDGLLGSRLGLDLPRDLPRDLVTLLGRSVSLSLGGDAPSGEITGPGELPVGLLVHGDPAKIERVLARVESTTSRSLTDLPPGEASRDDAVAVASSSTYAAQLVRPGGLGDSAAYQDAVPHADGARSVAFVSFSRDWIAALTRLARDAGEQRAVEVLDNLGHARALGVSTWVDGDVSHGLVRLTTR